MSKIYGPLELGSPYSSHGQIHLPNRVTGVYNSVGEQLFCTADLLKTAPQQVACWVPSPQQPLDPDFQANAAGQGAVPVDGKNKRKINSKHHLHQESLSWSAVV